MRYVVVFGNPIDGFEFWGPFATSEAAMAYAQAEADHDFWIATLNTAMDTKQ